MICDLFTFVDQSVYSSYSLPEQIRLLAILQLKNGIDKYWRRGAPNAISKEEKTHLRGRSLASCKEEPSAMLAMHAAIVNAKIVRFDFPNAW